MILVTGAAGKTGRAVMAALKAKNESVRALVHREDQRPTALAAGALHVQVGDMRRPSHVERAAQGVRAIYHICPNLSRNELDIGRHAIVAASRNQVQHFVFHSVLHPQTEDMPHHWQKLRVEEYLFKSGLPFTILQPTVYMQNVHAYIRGLLRDGALAVPYAATTRLGMVDLADVAQVASRVITETGHEGATYELAGPEVLTQTEIAGVLGRELGISSIVKPVGRREWSERARASGLGEYEVATLVKMFEYYERFGFWGNPSVLSWLLGHAPTHFAAFVRREISGQLATQPA